MDVPLNQPQAGLEEESPSDTHPLETPLDTARYEAILLRLHCVIDVAGLWAAIQSILSDIVANDAVVLCLNARDFSKSGYIPRILATPRASKFLKWMRPRDDGRLAPTLVGARPGTKICQASGVSFDPRQLERWRHIACLLFWYEGTLTSESTLTSEIAIVRTARQGAFSSQEIEALQRLHPHIEATLHRLIALERRERANAHRTSPVRMPNGIASDCERLTPAELQLIQLVHAGLSNKEIAARLHKSIRTVKTQLTSIYRKYGVRSRTRLLATMHGTAEARV